MTKTIRLPESIYKRLAVHAVAFDTPAQTIERLLNKIEGKKTPVTAPYHHSRKGVLSINFIPEDIDFFKEKLLEEKKAQIYEHYEDGRERIIHWNASRLKPSSNIIGNLRSRKEYRQGVWQRAGIKSLTVKI